MAKRSKSGGDFKDFMKLVGMIFVIVFFLLKGIFFVISKLFSLFQTQKAEEKTGQYIDENVLKDGLSKAYTLQYTDSDGELSERKILLQKVLGSERSNGELFVKYVQGYCYLRQEDRTFKIDRIQSLTDSETGEIIEGWGKIINHFRNVCKESVK